MALYENRASEEMSLLPEMVHARPTDEGSPKVLLQAGLQESQQGLAASTLAREARESGVWEQSGEDGKGAAVEEVAPGLLAAGKAMDSTLPDDIARSLEV